MDERSDTRLFESDELQQIVSALENGCIVVNSGGQIVWMDKRTRQRVNGGLSAIESAVRERLQSGVDCCVCTGELEINGKSKRLLLIQQSNKRKQSGHELVAAVEAVMADSSWFTRTITERLKAWLQASRPVGNPSDINLLTDRERDILGLICEGRSDAEMSEMLGLSHNTIRNHVASLYRKIGVNRRSAAIIWARERAITSQEALASTGRKRPRAAQRAK
jgi:DNA-binding CsgD family transcriptional regulator